MIGTFWQACAWSYQDQVARFQKDAAAIEKALQDLDEHLDDEWLVASELNDALDNKGAVADGEIQKLADKFDSIDTAWRTEHRALSAEFQISVNSIFFESKFFISEYPRRIKLIHDRANVSRSNCESYALRDQQPNGDDPLPVGIVLEVSYHCHDLIRRAIERRLHPAAADGVQGRPRPDSANPGLELSHAWWVDKVLQCMMVQRDLEVRNRTPVGELDPAIERKGLQCDRRRAVDGRNLRGAVQAAPMPGRLTV